MVRMKLFVLLGLSVLASAYVVDRNDEDSDRDAYLIRHENGSLRLMDLTDTRLEKVASLDDIIYYFYTRNNSLNPVVITNNNVDSLMNSGYFDPSKQTFFIIHGWWNNYKSLINTLITEALFDTVDVNVIVVDWSAIADRNYFTAKFSVKTIGDFIGNYINKIVKRNNMSYKNFVIIGHSLGAHVSGAAGAACNEKVDHIVGLDPAKPLFSMSNLQERLDPTDADFVHVIHTDGGRLGFFQTIGNADYYPNGGCSQPGCSIIDIVGTCAHSRSYEYYASSIKNQDQKFWAYKCKDYRDFQKGKCQHSYNLSVMGRIEVDKNASGKYFLNTLSKEPYCEPLVPKKIWE